MNILEVERVQEQSYTDKVIRLDNFLDFIINHDIIIKIIVFYFFYICFEKIIVFAFFCNLK